MPGFHFWAALCLVMSLAATGQPSTPFTRVANTTLRMPASPPVFGFTTEKAFGNLSIISPVAIATPPGETNRLFVIEKAGRVIVITNLANPTRTVFMDISDRVISDGEQGLLGLAFHPGYATNGCFFLFYTASVDGTPDRLSRFEVSLDNPNQGQPDSEVILFSQSDEASNNNGGDLHFGPDGYLYVSLGDEGGRDDTFSNSQRIDRNFFSGMLRLDVDKRPGNLEPNPHDAVIRDANGRAHYSVPADNPFAGTTTFNGEPLPDVTKIRTEFWAIGLRNPWRFWIDEPTGQIYCGDAGEDTREGINLVVRGGNYGWNYREGSMARPGSPDSPSDFAHISPIYDYPRSQGVSVTGGVVYRGQRFSQIYGAYIFADYGSGRLWALRYDGTAPARVEQLTIDPGISAFGVDPRNGDVLICDLAESTIKRLVYNSASTMPPLPSALSETGAFSDLRGLKPESGIVPYALNVPFWSDNAVKTRWFSLPDTNLTIGFSREGNWSFPAGTIWIKHFELERTNGVPESARRLETRFIVRNSNGVYGVTYRWGDSLTEATLVPEEGMDEAISVYANSVVRTQVWHYPSRAECLACHTAVGGWALGFNTPQMNCEVDHGAGKENQVQALGRAGYFDRDVTGIHTLRALASSADTAYSREYRVRSYLAANCAQCHQPGGPGLGFWDARISIPLSMSGLINGALKWNDKREDPENRVVTPGDLAHSTLLKRISTFGSHHMPPLDTTLLDLEAINLLTEWIGTDLTNYLSFAHWQEKWFGSTNAADAAPAADADGDRAPNDLEYLTGTNPRLGSEFWGISLRLAGDVAQVRFPRIANRGFEVQWTTNLFDPSSWQSLDVPGNRPIISATTQPTVVEDPMLKAATKYYRVRVFEP